MIQKKDYKDSRVVIVLGMHRSGTSLITSALHSLGVSLGDNLIPPSKDNPKGFWEDKKIVQINEKLLALQGKSWDSLCLDNFEGFEDALFDSLRSEANELINNDFSCFCLWGFKDPRMARLLGFWLPLLKHKRFDVSFVIAVRDPRDVAQSLAVRNGFSNEKSEILWFYQFMNVIEHTQTMRRIVVDYDQIIENPAGELIRLATQLDIPDIDIQKAILYFSQEIVDKSLCHTLKEVPLEQTESLAGLVYDCYQVLSDSAKDTYLHNGKAFDKQWKSITNRFVLLKPYINYVCKIDKLASNKRSGNIEQLTKEMVVSNDRIEQLENEWALRGDRIEQLENEWALRGDRIEQLENEWILRGDRIKQLEKDWVLRGNRIEKLDKEVSELLLDIKQRDSLIQSSNNERDSLREKLSQTQNELSAVKSASLLFSAYPVRWLIGNSSLLTKAVSSYRAGMQKLDACLFAKLHRLTHSKNNFISLNALTKKRALYACSAMQKKYLTTELSEWPELTISVVIYNSEKWLNQFIQSVCEQNFPTKKLSLIFVDHGSSDRTLEILDEITPRISLLFNDFQVFHRPNKGFGCGHDYAIRQALTKKVLITNIDLQFLPDTLTKLISCSEGDSDNVASWEVCQMPYEHPKYYDPITHEVSWSSHACVLMDREKYLEVGGYEKRIFMYGEDVELSYRFRSFGYSLRYVPDAKVYHYTYESAGQVKLLQFSGSTLANIYIRQRYGTWMDILFGYYLQFKLLLTGAGFSGSRKIVLGNITKSIINAPSFLYFRPKRKVAFSFFSFDYEMIRDGAFYPLHELGKDDVPLVTIITRTVQGRGFLLRECIASALNQTYPNIEHLVIEDGGGSASAMVEKIALNFCDVNGYEIRHIVAPKLGRSHAGNIGLANARGQYIVFLDDDDLIYPDHVEVLYKALSEKKVDAAYSLAWEVLTTVDKTTETYEENIHQTLPLFHQEFSREVLFNHNYLPLQSVLFSRKLFEKCGGFEVDMNYLEDWNLWCRYAVDHEFTFVCKTTSIYKTPSEIEERVRRANLLHDAYEDAKRRQESMFD